MEGVHRGGLYQSAHVCLTVGSKELPSLTTSFHSVLMCLADFGTHAPSRTLALIGYAPMGGFLRSDTFLQYDRLLLVMSERSSSVQGHSERPKVFFS